MQQSLACIRVLLSLILKGRLADLIPPSSFQLIDPWKLVNPILIHNIRYKRFVFNIQRIVFDNIFFIAFEYSHTHESVFSRPRPNRFRHRPTAHDAYRARTTPQRHHRHLALFGSPFYGHSVFNQVDSAVQLLGCPLRGPSAWWFFNWFVIVVREDSLCEVGGSFAIKIWWRVFWKKSLEVKWNGWKAEEDSAHKL